MNRSELVKGMRRGDEVAWIGFVDEFAGLIYSVSRRFRLDDAETDDHFQGVCLSALRAVEGLEKPARLASWVYNIAHNLAVDMIRGRRRNVDLETCPSVEELTSEPKGQARLERLERAAFVRDGLDALDERCRRLLHALFLEEPRIGYEEIAQRENMPLGSVSPTRARCLKKLKKHLEELSNEL